MPTTIADQLDWSAHYQVKSTKGEAHNQQQDQAFQPNWENALLYDTKDVREFVTNGGLCHERVSDTFLVAYNFSFSIAPTATSWPKGSPTQR